MFCAKHRPTLFSSLPLAHLAPWLTHHFLRALGWSAFVFSLLLPLSGFAGEVSLTWDAAPDPNLAGYRLYYGYAKGSYEGVLEVGQETTYTLTDLEEGQAYYFALVAYDVHGEESELSQEVAHNGPPPDAEEDTDENALPDQAEIDQAQSDAQPVSEAASEMDADEPDPLQTLEQHAEDDYDHDRSTARTELQVIPQSELRIVAVDSETLVGEGAAESAIDGRVETFWHTKMGAKASMHPHELVIALGGEYVVSGFRYLPRQDGKRNGMVGRYSFYVSETGEDWGQAVASGTFSGDMVERQVTFPHKVGSFVRFVAHTEVNGKPWTSVAELNVLGVR
jgi:F5/8 type C domain-containing protein/fibronectin type III domain protein